MGRVESMDQSGRRDASQHVSCWLAARTENVEISGCQSHGYATEVCYMYDFASVDIHRAKALSGGSGVASNTNN